MPRRLTGVFGWPAEDSRPSTKRAPSHLAFEGARVQNFETLRVPVRCLCTGAFPLETSPAASLLPTQAVLGAGGASADAPDMRIHLAHEIFFERTLKMVSSP